MQTVKLFDVLQIDFGKTIGSEQGKIRPAIVCQNDDGNKYGPTILVVPLTTELKKTYMPTHAIIHSSHTNGLSEDSMLLGEQMRVIDKKRILYKRGYLNTESEKDSVVQVYLANLTGKKRCSIVAQ